MAEPIDTAAIRRRADMFQPATGYSWPHGTIHTLCDALDRASAQLTVATAEMRATERLADLACDRRDRLAALIAKVAAGKRIRHDHMYPMEVGPHHCGGCDIEAEIAAVLAGSGGEPTP